MTLIVIHTRSSSPWVKQDIRWQRLVRVQLHQFYTQHNFRIRYWREMKIIEMIIRCFELFFWGIWYIERSISLYVSPCNHPNMFLSILNTTRHFQLATLLNKVVQSSTKHDNQISNYCYFSSTSLIIKCTLCAFTVSSIVKNNFLWKSHWLKVFNITDRDNGLN